MSDTLAVTMVGVVIALASAITLVVMFVIAIKDGKEDEDDGQRTGADPVEGEVSPASDREAGGHGGER